MTFRPSGILLGSILVSVGLHAAAFVGFGLMLKPEPVQHKTLPQPQVNIQSQKVERLDARADTARAEHLDESVPNTRKAKQSDIQQSTAHPVELPQAKISTDVPAAVKTKAIRGSAAPIEIQEFEAASVAAVVMSSPIVRSQTARGEAAPAVTGLTDALQQAALPESAVQSVALKDRAATAASLPLPSEKGVASLAWTGGADDKVEAASLAAIQAFMQPGDVDQSDSNIGNVRDGIGAILASVPCARLQTTFLPETGTLELRGHIPDDALRGPVLAALSEQIGGAIAVSDQVLILPRPQCGALSGIAKVGLPQSTEQLTNPRVIGTDGFAQNYTYTDGQRLELDLVAPDYDSYVYVDYFAADGSVIHLQPNETVPLEFFEAKTLLSVGRERGGKPSLDITVSPPFGQEIAAAFAASEPLYEETRPLQEPAGPYLEFLKERVTRARVTNSDFKGEWVYFFISTKAQ